MTPSCFLWEILQKYVEALPPGTSKSSCHRKIHPKKKGSEGSMGAGEVPRKGGVNGHGRGG